MRNGNPNYASFLNLACEYAFSIVFLPEIDPAAIVPLGYVRCERSLRDSAYSVESWKQTTFNKNLEAVADSQNRPTLIHIGAQFLAQLCREPSCPNYSCANVVPK